MKNIWLLLVSLVFYAWGEPIYIVLMLFSITINYFLGKKVEMCPKSKEGKRIVLIACLINLGMLFVFKYLAWLISLFIGEAIYQTPLAGLSLPIGISFYTFQALSYVIDVYRGKDKAQQSILNVGLYIAFFPQLIAGPIVRYNSIAEQLLHREHTFEKFAEGAKRFTIGLSKKVIIANHVAVVAEQAFGATSYRRSVVFAWVGALAFMLQIYFDFSGYSDMAIGLGKMFGFEFRENFNYPYISKSITEYWRRWHISLGEWFRDYLFYPFSLGPAVRLRKKIVKKVGRKQSAVVASVLTLFVVWMSTGIWHGANMTFVLWGFIQFAFLVFEQYRKPLKNKKLGAVLGFTSTFFVILFTKVIFNAASVTHAFYYYGSMFHLTGNNWIDAYGNYWISQYKFFLIIGFILIFPVVETFNKKVKESGNELIIKLTEGVEMFLLFLCLIVDVILAASGGYNPFIYFNF
ncbi:MAG: MBOAT family protein [Dorea sp.]|nr:MBOAT family protein [Dorea sp.]